MCRLSTCMSPTCHRSKPHEKSAWMMAATAAADTANDDAVAQRVGWLKYNPYIKSAPLPLQPLTNNNNNNNDTDAIDYHPTPALCFRVHQLSGRARACTLHLKMDLKDDGNSNSNPKNSIHHRPVPTPMFMPVGTKGCLKGVALDELVAEHIQCPIILANTYHLAIQPGTVLIEEMGHLHHFQGMPQALSEQPENTTNTTKTNIGNQTQPQPAPQRKPYNLLTDSGGFQMVSLAKLSKITEDGVLFTNPYKSSPNDDDMLMLRPEDSIRHQNRIGAQIIMALDDVVSSVADDAERFQVATHRTLRWYDRCRKAHARPDVQNLFPIVQGGLDVSPGGLRDQCLAGLRERDAQEAIPGFAIGGLAGGESKDAFWRVVDHCCRALPDTKPRYLMGVGYPLDLVVCTALGCDMYDCVYPTRTARFGVALVPGPQPLKLRSHACAQQNQCVIQDGCPCQACGIYKISRARLQAWLKAGNPLATELVTQHNICYMMTLVADMRQAILELRYPSFVRNFVRAQFPERGADRVPQWVRDALHAAGIDLDNDDVDEHGTSKHAVAPQPMAG